MAMSKLTVVPVLAALTAALTPFAMAADHAPTAADWQQFARVWEAGEPVPVSLVEALLQRTGGTRWYAVEISGARAGYMSVSAALVDDTDGPRLRIETYVRIHFAVDGKGQQIAGHHIEDYDASLRPTRIELWRDTMGRLSQTSVSVVDPASIRVSVTQPDGTHERTVPLPPDFSSELMLSIAMLAGRIQPGWTASFSAFDPYSAMLDRYRVSVPDQAGDDMGTLVYLTSEQAGVTMRTWIGEDGVMRRQALPELMAISMQLCTREEALAPVVGPSLQSDISVGTPQTNPHQAEQVRLIASAAGTDAASMIPEVPYQHVEARADGSALITISRHAPPAKTVALPIAGAEFAQYLGPNEITQSDSEQIRGLAHQIVGDETDAWAAAQKLLSWVYRNIGKVTSEPRPISAVEVLAQRKGDCTEHAVLLAALAKAVGIPPRIVTGLVYINGSYGYHEWNELYVGEWVSMDPSWGKHVLGAGHIQLSSEAADADAILRNNIASGRTIGTLFLEFHPNE